MYLKASVLEFQAIISYIQVYWVLTSSVTSYGALGHVPPLEVAVFKIWEPMHKSNDARRPLWPGSGHYPARLLVGLEHFLNYILVAAAGCHDRARSHHDACAGRGGAAAGAVDGL